MSTFEMGQLTISQLAHEQLAKLNLDAEEYFARHQNGEWGDVDERTAGENQIAASKEKSLLAITSRHKLSPDVELLIITATDHSRTHLQLASEYQVVEASSQEGYAVWAATYDDVPNLLIMVEAPIVQEILDDLPPLTSAIDVGTGTGRHALALARRGLQVVGYDESAEMLAVAQAKADAEKLTNVRFAQVSLGSEPLPAPSNHFDLLTCSLMLCHLPNLKTAVAECVRTMRPGGYLLISDFHPDAIRFGWRSAFPTPTTHYNFPNTLNSRRDYLDALADAGCAILEVHDAGVDGQPYGAVSVEAIKNKGLPPFCLVILAQKQANPVGLSDPIMTRASQLLSQQVGTPMQLSRVTCITDELRRNRLLRIGIANPPAGFPATLMIKQVVAKEYNPDQIESEDTQRFFRDWAGAEFLSSLPSEPAYGPRFYGGDRDLGFVILEDLGEIEQTLVEPLLEGDAASAENSLLHYMKRLGKMHADTAGKLAEYEAIFRRANPAWANVKRLQGEPSLTIPHFSNILTLFQISVVPALLLELQGIYQRIQEPGPFSVFLHADLCPDNMFFVGNEVKFFDFETACFGHALIDGCYPRIPYPSCWCCNRIPKSVVQKLEAAYRAELIRGCPAAADDQLYAQGLGDACVFWLLEFLRWWELPPAPQEDGKWGIASIRSRVLSRLETAIETTTEFDLLPMTRNAANKLLPILQKQWHEVELLPLYPAFHKKE